MFPVMKRVRSAKRLAPCKIASVQTLTNAISAVKSLYHAEVLLSTEALSRMHWPFMYDVYVGTDSTVDSPNWTLLSWIGTPWNLTVIYGIVYLSLHLNVH
jgi:hypothetical protein